MQKDVIYIDVDDDITTVIGKVKSAEKKIVALVPPKRVGMLQSAVNLRLLNRAAEQKNKKLVLISNNQQLANLAAMTSIPVAKTLQSKPEIAPIAALDIDNGEEVIDGSSLPVADHVAQTDAVPAGPDATTASAVGAAAVSSVKPAKSIAKPDSAKKPKVKKGAVPDFNKFRKRLILIILGVLLLVGLLIWAIFFAPRANVIVTMRTTDAAVSQQVTLSRSAETSVKNSIISAETKQLKKDVSATISATGEKNVGKKATGPVEFSHQSLESRTVEAGTELRTGGGFVYILDADVVIPASKFGPPNCFPTACPGKANGTVTAAEPGEKYNNASGGLSGSGSGVKTNFTSPTSGGTDKMVDVVTKNDIEEAKDSALQDVDKDSAASELKKQFGNEYIVVEDSFSTSTSDVKPNVKVGDEVSSGSPKVNGKVTFTLYAVEKAELDTYLKRVLEQQLDDSDAQRVYSSGADEATFTNIDKSDSGISANLTTNGSTGPNITDEDIKELARGKRYGEVKTAVEAINGVETVDVEFSTFWVRKVPNDDAKIIVEFNVNGTQ